MLNPFAPVNSAFLKCVAICGSIKAIIDIGIINRFSTDAATGQERISSRSNQWEIPLRIHHDSSMRFITQSEKHIKSRESKEYVLSACYH